MPTGAAAALRMELVGLSGIVERNAYLNKRYIWWDVAWFVWTVANTLTIVFIAKGIEATMSTRSAAGKSACPSCRLKKMATTPKSRTARITP